MLLTVDTVHAAQSIVLAACSSGFFALLYPNFKATYLGDVIGGKQYFVGFFSQWSLLFLRNSGCACVFNVGCSYKREEPQKSCWKTDNMYVLNKIQHGI
ncbi:hypothetical protein NPIL_220291 [Nephila pilipes]|uniref:Uncharacterized protein n=1 Tax=Nephila pilipes TaxID=299642 RepID=A0A8X6NEL9_NEPPI|nr:hypothetical protein NPIL_220291 [Nephila pilipes]